MMFQPVIPFAGLSGWRFLQNTYDRQFENFAKSPVLDRDADYFRDNIAKIETANELVSDRRLMTVALGSFGLQDDINNRYFIRKILEEGTTNADALANRFADPRYAELSSAFGFGVGETRQHTNVAFADDMIARFQQNGFEAATGEKNEAMRIALYAQRKIGELSKAEGSVDTKWFQIMGDPPLRKLFENAMNLPSSFGKIDIDQQLGVFKQRAKKIFGTNDLNDFGDPQRLQSVITKYIVRDQINSFSGGLSSGAIALSLLQR